MGFSSILRAIKSKRERRKKPQAPPPSHRNEVPRAFSGHGEASSGMGGIDAEIARRLRNLSVSRKQMILERMCEADEENVAAPPSAVISPTAWLEERDRCALLKRHDVQPPRGTATLSELIELLNSDDAPLPQLTVAAHQIKSILRQSSEEGLKDFFLPNGEGIVALAGALERVRSLRLQRRDKNDAAEDIVRTAASLGPEMLGAAAAALAGQEGGDADSDGGEEDMEEHNKREVALETAVLLCIRCLLGRAIRIEESRPKVTAALFAAVGELAPLMAFVVALSPKSRTHGLALSMLTVFARRGAIMQVLEKVAGELDTLLFSEVVATLIKEPRLPAVELDAMLLLNAVLKAADDAFDERPELRYRMELAGIDEAMQQLRVHYDFSLPDSDRTGDETGSDCGSSLASSSNGFVGRTRMASVFTGGDDAQVLADLLLEMDLFERVREEDLGDEDDLSACVSDDGGSRSSSQDGLGGSRSGFGRQGERRHSQGGGKYFVNDLNKDPSVNACIRRLQGAAPEGSAAQSVLMDLLEGLEGLDEERRTCGLKLALDAVNALALGASEASGGTATAPMVPRTQLSSSGIEALEADSDDDDGGGKVAAPTDPACASGALNTAVLVAAEAAMAARTRTAAAVNEAKTQGGSSSQISVGERDEMRHVMTMPSGFAASIAAAAAAKTTAKTTGGPQGLPPRPGAAAGGANPSSPSTLAESGGGGGMSVAELMAKRAAAGGSGAMSPAELMAKRAAGAGVGGGMSPADLMARRAAAGSSGAVSPAELMAKRAGAGSGLPTNSVPRARDPAAPVMRAIYWEKLSKADPAFDGSVFRQMDPTGNEAKDIVPVAELMAAFTLKKAAPLKTRAGTAASTGAGSRVAAGIAAPAATVVAAPRVSLLEGEKMHSAEIIFVALRLKPEIIRDALLSMDMEVFRTGSAGPEEKLQRLFLAVNPDQAELKKLRGYEGPLEHLSDTQRFMVMAARIPRYSDRLQCTLLFTSLESEVAAARKELAMVHQAITELEESPKLRRLLLIVLAWGNHLNNGSLQGDAAGFALSTLSKVANVKTADNKRTFLHVLCEWAEHRGGEDAEVLDLAEDLESAQHAAGASISSFQAQAESFRAKLKLVRKQIAACQRDAAAAAAAVTAAAAEAAGGGDAAGGKVAATAAKTNESGEAPDRFLTVMEPFLKKAEGFTKALDAHIATADVAYARTAVLYGEDPKQTPNNELFAQVVLPFLFQLRQAKADTEQRLKEQRRRRDHQDKLAERRRRSSQSLVKFSAEGSLSSATSAVAVTARRDSMEEQAKIRRQYLAASAGSAGGDDDSTEDDWDPDDEDTRAFKQQNEKAKDQNAVDLALLRQRTTLNATQRAQTRLFLPYNHSVVRGGDGGGASGVGTLAFDAGRSRRSVTRIQLTGASSAALQRQHSVIASRRFMPAGGDDGKGGGDGRGNGRRGAAAHRPRSLAVVANGDGTKKRHT